MSIDVMVNRHVGRSVLWRPRVPKPGERRRLRILLSSAGRRVGLLRAFRSSAEALDIDLEIFACDLLPEWSSACLEADYAFAVPPADSEAFIPTVLDVCRRNAIVLVVPTIDTELLPYSQSASRFAEIGTTVAISAPGIIETARDKLATAAFLHSAGVPAPPTVAVEDVISGMDTGWEWPLLAKPRHGSSSRGIIVVKSKAELQALDLNEPYVVQKMLTGREFTVNIFFDDAGRLKSAVPHERLKVRAGEVEKAVTVRDVTLLRIARNLAAAFDGPLGAMCFQAFMDEKGAFSVFEINARFGGGYPLAHRAGATFARWMIEERLNLPRTTHDDWRAGVVMLRFDDAVFV